MSRPTRRAIAATVCGLSPEMILTSTPCDAKKSSVSLASGRTCSRQRHQRERPHPDGQDLPVERGVAVAEEHDPQTGPRLLDDLFAQWVLRGEQDVGRTEDVGAAVRERRRAPLAGRVEGDGLRASQPCGASSAAAKALNVPFALGSSANAPSAVSRSATATVAPPPARSSRRRCRRQSASRSCRGRRRRREPGPRRPVAPAPGPAVAPGRRRPGGTPRTSAGPAPRGPAPPDRRSTGR